MNEWIYEFCPVFSSIHSDTCSVSVLLYVVAFLMISLLGVCDIHLSVNFFYLIKICANNDIAHMEMQNVLHLAGLRNFLLDKSCSSENVVWLLGVDWGAVYPMISKT